MTTDNLALETVDNNLQAGAEAEPIKLTEEAAVTDQADQEPGQEVENLDAPVVEKAEGSDATDDDENVQYLELDGKEHSLDDIRAMRDGSMMQSDYTKKTTVLADERTTFEAERETDRENLLKSQTEVSEMRDQLAVLVAEDEEIDWVELKEEDPEKYIELKEKAENRKAALEKVKADRETPFDDPVHIQTEQGKLFSANPEWLDKDGKFTEVHANDIALISNYATKAGFSNEEFKHMTFAHHQVTLLKAARYDELQEKGREIKAKREKVPLVTKPKATTTGGQQKSNGSIFFPNLK